MEDCYIGRVMINCFYDKIQVFIIGFVNNVNDQGFLGGGFCWRCNNGLNVIKMLGVNFVIEIEKLELGGSMCYNYCDVDVVIVGFLQCFLQLGDFYFNLNKVNSNKEIGFKVDFCMEWCFDLMINIIFWLNVFYDKIRGVLVVELGIFNEDFYQYVVNFNDYLNFDNIEFDDLLRDICINVINEYNLFKLNSLLVNVILQLNWKLNNEGCNIIFCGLFGYGDDDSDQYV